MLFVFKGLTRLTVSFDDVIKVEVQDVPDVLLHTSRAIASSLKNLLRIKIKYSDNPNKHEVVKSYLQQLGWHIR